MPSDFLLTSTVIAQAGELGGGTPAYLSRLVNLSVEIIEAAGIAVILLGFLVATLVFLWQAARSVSFRHTYLTYRQNLGRSIVVGLEFLIGADIIKTVVIEPTFQSVGVLGAIIVARTFLSMMLELEINKRWPWQEQPPSESEKL